MSITIKNKAQRTAVIDEEKTFTRHVRREVNLDQVEKRLEQLTDERSIVAHQLDRIDLQIADLTDVKTRVEAELKKP
jgi:hypothetical protein